MKIKRIAIGLFAALSVWAGVYAGSTIDPTVPVTGSALQSSVVRNNFAAAYNDVNNILGMYAGTTAPTSPTTYQFWADTSGGTSNVIVRQYDGTQWVPVATLNATAHTWKVNVASGASGVLPVLNGGTGVSTSTGTGSVVLQASPTITGTVSGSATYNSVRLSGTTSLPGSGSLDSTGRLTLGAQPSVFAYVSANTAGVTGNGAVYTVIFDTAAFDQNSNFNTGTGTFVAPVAGKYLISSCLMVSSLPAGATTAQMRIVTTARSYRMDYNPISIASGAGLASKCMTVVANMAASDTQTVTLTITGGAGDTAIVIGTGAIVSFVSISKVA